MFYWKMLKDIFLDASPSQNLMSHTRIFAVSGDPKKLHLPQPLERGDGPRSIFLRTPMLVELKVLPTSVAFFFHYARVIDIYRPSSTFRNLLRRRRRQNVDLYEEYSAAAEASEDASQLSPGFLWSIFCREYWTQIAPKSHLPSWNSWCFENQRTLANPPKRW